MAWTEEYKDCKICGTTEGRFYQECITGELDDTCFYCGDSHRISFNQLTGEAIETHSKGYGTIHTCSKEGLSRIDILDKPLTEEEINEIIEFFKTEDIDKKESFVLSWCEEESKLKTIIGKYPIKSDISCEFKTISEDEIPF